MGIPTRRCSSAWRPPASPSCGPTCTAQSGCACGPVWSTSRTMAPTARDGCGCPAPRTGAAGSEGKKHGVRRGCPPVGTRRTVAPLPGARIRSLSGPVLRRPPAVAGRGAGPQRPGLRRRRAPSPGGPGGRPPAADVRAAPHRRGPGRCVAQRGPRDPGRPGRGGPGGLRGRSDAVDDAGLRGCGTGPAPEGGQGHRTGRSGGAL